MKKLNILRKFLFLAILFGTSLSTVLAQTSHTVTTVGSSGFNPSVLTINVGDTVVFTNSGGTHNVNGTQATYPSNPESFGGFPASSSAGWPFTHVFTIAGTYDYVCDPHAGNGMDGQIIVNNVVTPCSDLFLSEYSEGSSNNKYMEIYNPTNSAINLSGYNVQLIGNGGSFTNNFALDGTIGPKGTYVISTNQADSVIQAFADTALGFPSVAHFNGDDAILLFNPLGDTLDIFGTPGFDPGSAWDIQSIQGDSVETRNLTLIRGAFVTQGSTDWNVVQGQWYALPIDQYRNINYHNAVDCGNTLPGYMIAQLEGLDASLIPDSLGVSAQIAGVVHNPDQGFNSSEFAIQDGSAGIWVTGADSISGYSGATEGDAIRVYGTVDFSNGVTQFDADSIEVLTAFGQLHLPVMTDTLNEVTEGWYVQLDSVRIINAPQDTFDIGGSGQNFDIVTLDQDTFTLRVDRDYELEFEGNPVPTGLFNVRGVASQFDFSAPHNSGYQIFPSRYSDLELLAGATDAIAFTTSSDDAGEADGSYMVMVTVGDTLAAPATIDVENTGNGTAALGNDFTFNDTTLTFAANTIDTFMLEIGIVDNAVVNPNRTVELALRNVTGALIGLDSIFTLTIINDEFPTYDIGTLRGNDNLGGSTNVGVADSLGVVCRVVGVALAPNIGGGNLIISVQDATGGIGVFMPGSANPPAVMQGDSVEIVGEVTQFNGLSQMSNITSLNILSSNNPRPMPNIVDSLGEFTESNLIRMENMSFVDVNDWINSAGQGSFNIDITNGVDTFQMRVDSDLPLANQTTPPVAPFDVIGFGGQFDSSDPYTDGYQIFAIDSVSFITIVENIPTYDISQVNTIDGQGVADSLGVECKIEGIVYGENFRDGAGGLEFTLIDSASTDEGIAVFSSNGLGYTVTEGDKIRVIGTIDQVFGLTRISADSVVLISSANPLASAVSVTDLDEFSESNLVMLDSVKYIADGSWTGTGSAFEVSFASATDTFTVRIDNDCDLYSATEPSNGAYYDVTGIGGQVDFASPFDEGYNLLPRSSADLVQLTPGTPVAGFTFAINGATVDFTNTSVGANTYFWDFGDTSLSISTNPSHTYTANGTYTVTLAASNAFGSDTIQQQVTITAVGLGDEIANAISIYPNPAQGELFIKNLANKNAEIRIIDALGREIRAVETSNELTKINLDGISRGQYFVQIISENEISVEKIFINE